MPKFIDYHATLPPMPPEAMDQMRKTIQSGQTGPDGMRPLNVFVSKGGSGWCLCEAPNAEAVVRVHQQQGIPLDSKDVHEVTSLV